MGSVISFASTMYIEISDIGKKWCRLIPIYNFIITIIYYKIFVNGILFFNKESLSKNTIRISMINRIIIVIIYVY